MDLSGKVALVNGGARMGTAIARALAAKGCAIVATYRRSRGAADETAQTARELGVPAETLQADALDDASVRAAVGEAVRRLGRLDVLVNMGSTYVSTPFERLDRAAWQDGIDSNALSAFLFSIHAVPHMRRAGSGRIVNFADWLPVSRRPRYQGYLPYYVGKAAVAGLTEALALELAPEILVNAVAPGPVMPPEGISPEEERRVVEATPLRRWGGPEEMARTVVFLAESDFVTGECIRADGGRHLD